MGKRKVITVFLMSITAALALVISWADLFEESDMICATSACEKIHSSSFATVFDLPVGIYAALLMTLALFLYMKEKTRLSTLLLWAILGAEAYYTFIQFVFIESLCASCMIFFSLLVGCLIASGLFQNRSLLVKGTVMGISMFLAAHFVFFFPSVTLKPTLIQSLPDRAADIEIFASPSCTHCEEAIEKLQGLCAAGGKQLIVRPVSISAKDREKSIQWVAGELFKCGTATSFRLAEKIVWENEADAKKISGETLQVPLILVRSNDLQRVFKGWNRQIQENIFSLFPEFKAGVRIAEAGTIEQFMDLENHGAFCSSESRCHENE